MYQRHLALLLCALCSASLMAQKPFRPTPEELKASYERANGFQKLVEGKSRNLTLAFGWIENGKALWYRRELPDGKKEFLRVEPIKKQKTPAFDHAALAKALALVLKREVAADSLPFSSIVVEVEGSISFQTDGSTYRFNPTTGVVAKGERLDQSRILSTEVADEPDPNYPAPFLANYSPIVQQDGPARVREGQVEIKVGETWTVITKQGGYARAEIQLGGTKIIGFRLIPGERKMVYLLKAAVIGTTRAALEQRLYDQPGDRLDEFETWLIDPATKSETKLNLAPIMGGGQPWAGPPGIRWKGDYGFLSFPIRGYQEHKIVRINPAGGAVKTIIHEKSPTFIDQSKTGYNLVKDGRQVLWQSERDGWNHLYLVDAETGLTKQLTKGEWVVRNVVNVDEVTGQVTFTASSIGNSASENPYHLHMCRVNLDGTGFTRLTNGDGSHDVSFSTDRSLYLDTYSRVDQVPVHELRDGKTGNLVMVLEKAVTEAQVKLPERFVAKARDGKADIWGIVVWPSNFDPKQKYPVIENIYAGPHDNHVPRSFRPFFNMHRLAELGFIVVQIDGMGTNNRGKAFHDVAYKNIADAGFPDRILWLKALAKKHPQLDLDRVGVYGTSAGGQSSTGAMLLHGDFYKVAVSSCGCHDNRIDKQWWNEQWMGYPVGIHYDQQSNLNLVKNLRGKLMLIVGEQDRNVPPETTFRLADALIKAQKEFDLVVIPGADHTDGGPYGERKRRDFFVRWLHGVEPPSWND